MSGSVILTIKARPGERLLVPAGLSTPHALCTGFEVITHSGSAGLSPVDEAGTGQTAFVIDCGAEDLTLRYDYEAGGEDYPDVMFTPRASRYSRAADGLIEDARRFAGAPDAARDLATHVAELFTYGHPDTRFYDAHDEIPQICSMTVGSCVDINFYFMASLRAAGVETGYVVGPFFPAEKCAEDGSGWCNDNHCWVVTRDAHGIREWDIAHHLKLGTREITPALDPKPGKRFAMGHSMGLTFPEIGMEDIKLVSDPMWIAGDNRLDAADTTIRCV